MARVSYNSPKCVFTVDGGHIVTDGSVRNKVTGTSMAGILGCSPFSSPFQVACALLGVCRENLDGKPAIETGKVLEPVIIDYLGRTYPDKGCFLPAEDVYEKRAGDHDSWESDFPDEVFAGHVDGIVTSADGVDRILEIKTSSNMDSWAEGVPEYYYWQVGLYNEFITQQDSAVVGLGIVDGYTRRNPLSWAPNERNTVLFEMPIDREQVRKGMEQVQDWYNQYIVRGVTPDYDPTNPRDVAMYQYLKNISADVGDVQKLVDRVGEIDYEIRMIEGQSKALYDERDSLKERIRSFMDVHEMSTLEGAEMPYVISLSPAKRSSIDKTAMALDGIDPEKYIKYTETKYFKIKTKE